MNAYELTLHIEHPSIQSISLQRYLSQVPLPIGYRILPEDSVE